MKTVSRFRNSYAFVRGNFLILIITWILMNFTGPIPQTNSSLHFISLGANKFLIGVIGFAASIALALVQFPGGYLAVTQLLTGALYAFVWPQLPFILLAGSATPLSAIVFFKVFDPASKEA